MKIDKIDIKTKLIAGSALAVLSGFVPPATNVAIAGTSTMPVTVQIVTAVNLANTNALDFGRLAITGAMTGNNHTLSPGGATTTAGGASVVIAGSPGDFDITGGTAAGNVQIAYTNTVTYAGGNIVLNRVTLSGPALTGTPQVANGATITHNLVGGGNTAVNVGGRLNFVANPAVGSYNGTNATITVIDIP